MTTGKLVKIPTPVLSSFSFFSISLFLFILFSLLNAEEYFCMFLALGLRGIKYALFAATQMTGFNPSSHDKLHEVQVLAGFSSLFNPSSTFQLSFFFSLSLFLFIQAM